MAENFENEVPEIIIMKDDEGAEVEFFVVNAVESEGKKYMLIVEVESYDLDEPEAYIIKEVGESGDEMAFEFVDDENEYARVAVLMSDEDNEYEIKL